MAAGETATILVHNVPGAWIGSTDSCDHYSDYPTNSHQTTTLKDRTINTRISGIAGKSVHIWPLYRSCIEEKMAIQRQRALAADDKKRRLAREVKA